MLEAIAAKVETFLIDYGAKVLTVNRENKVQEDRHRAFHLLRCEGLKQLLALIKEEGET